MYLFQIGLVETCSFLNLMCIHHLKRKIELPAGKSLLPSDAPARRSITRGHCLSSSSNSQKGKGKVGLDLPRNRPFQDFTIATVIIILEFLTCLNLQYSAGPA